MVFSIRAFYFLEGCWFIQNTNMIACLFSHGKSSYGFQHCLHNLLNQLSNHHHYQVALTVWIFLVLSLNPSLSSMAFDGPTSRYRQVLAARLILARICEGAHKRTTLVFVLASPTVSRIFFILLGWFWKLEGNGCSAVFFCGGATSRIYSKQLIDFMWSSDLLFLYVFSERPWGASRQ